MRVDVIGGDHHLIDKRVVGLTAIYVSWPAFDSGRIFWSRGCFGDRSGCPGGVAELRSGTYTPPLTSKHAAGPAYVLAHERDAGVTWVLQDDRTPTGSPGWCGDATTPTCSIQPLSPAYTG